VAAEHFAFRILDFEMSERANFAAAGKFQVKQKFEFSESEIPSVSRLRSAVLLLTSIQAII